MTAFQTAEEVAKRHLAAMGSELGPLFTHCRNECAWLHIKWREYLALFGTNEKRVDLLNQAASSFFAMLQDSLWEDLLLHLCRVTDPPQSAGKDTLTVQRIANLVPEPLRSELQPLLADLLSKREFARDWRNRQIAHTDLALAVGKNAKPLERATTKSFTDVLAALVALLNKVEWHYTKSSTAYGDLAPLSGAEGLLHVLYCGVEAENDRRERIRAGRPRQGDFDRPEL